MIGSLPGPPAGAAWPFDHAILLVDDLSAASRDFRQLGFTVTAGGDHANFISKNALIGFADGSYLELLAIKSRLGPLLLRWAQRTGLLSMLHPSVQAYASGEGLKAFSLRVDSIGQALEEIRSKGLEWGDPRSGGRRAPSGETIAFQTAVPPCVELPFLCADVTAHGLRVPSGPNARHANGVLAVSGLTLGVTDLAASRQRYLALPGCRQRRDAGSTPGPRRVVNLELGSFTVTLEAVPKTSREALRRGVATDPGLRALHLRTAERSAVGSLKAHLTHGARIVLESA